MKRIFSISALLLLLFLWGSCRKDFETVPSSGNLEFSRDTVYLDTVFTNIGSSTYNLRVYNRSNDDIGIPTIRLREADASKYRLNVDGLAGTSFDDITVLAKDSIFIFIETTVDIGDFTANNDQFLYTDAIQFDQGPNQQQVELVTLVQDAVFLFPERFNDGSTETLILGEGTENETEIEGFFLDDTQLGFSNQKPYVIYGYAAVGANKTLTVDAGARIHFHRDSGLIIGNQGSLQINGALSTDQEILENEVVFEGDRLETAFADVPGQWGAIWLTEGSTNNRIEHATIKNGSIGLLVDSNDGNGNPTLVLKNSQLHNHANFGMLARTAIINTENTVFGSAGQSSLYLNVGGTYDFKHCTFANYFSKGFREFPTILIDNFAELEDNSIFARDLTMANFTNCIISGDNNLELFLLKAEEAAFNYNLKNCMLQFNDVTNQFTDNALYNFGNPVFYENLFLNEDADFLDPHMNQFLIGLNSAAIGQGDLSTANEVPLDILGVSRTVSPDLGAYQAVEFEITN